MSTKPLFFTFKDCVEEPNRDDIERFTEELGFDIEGLLDLTELVQAAETRQDIAFVLWVMSMLHKHTDIIDASKFCEAGLPVYNPNLSIYKAIGKCVAGKPYLAVCDGVSTDKIKRNMLSFIENNASDNNLKAKEMV